MANVDNTNLGALWSWFTSCDDFPRKFSLVAETNYKYVPISAYLCTLSQGCFELLNLQHTTTEEGPKSSVTSDQLILSEMAMLIIQNFFQDSVSDTSAQSKSCTNKSSVPVISITAG